MPNQTTDDVTEERGDSTSTGSDGADRGREERVASSPSRASNFSTDEESVARFYHATQTNADELQRFKRHRRQIESIDRASPVVLLLAGVMLGLAAYLSRTPYATAYFGADLAALVLTAFFAGLLFVRLLYSVATWRSRLDSERVAAYELRHAVDAFADESDLDRDGGVSDFDADAVVSHLAEVREFLGYATAHDLLAPRHAVAISEYATQIENATDRRASLEETFPTVAGVAVVAFANPDCAVIRDQSTSVPTDRAGVSNATTAFRRDARLLVEHLLSRQVAVVSGALALGFVVAFSYGVWRGTTIGLGALVSYAVVRNLRL